MLKVSRWIYLAAAGLFLLGVVTQVFLAGMTIVARQMSWNNHIGVGHLLSAPLLFMLISQYTGRLPGRMKKLGWLLFGVYILQADVLIFLRVAAPVASAFHPVLALVDFTLGFALLRAAWPLARQAQAQASFQTELKSTANAD
jgi:hypothetical protein